jgi:predicted acylesterase/phospholipase RssA
MTSEVSSLPIVLAISGGGYRAAAFALGVLRYLDDLGLVGNVAVVSSVSGGGLVNLLIHDSDLGQLSPLERTQVYNSFSDKLTTQSVWFSDPLCAAYFGCLLAIPVMVVGLAFTFLFAAVLGLQVPDVMRYAFFPAGVGSWALLSLRNRFHKLGLSKAFGASDTWRPERRTANIFCVTDLESGQFMVLDGETYPQVSLAKTICITTGFPVLTKPFAEGTDNRLRLVDGGVANNLGTQLLESVLAAKIPLGALLFVTVDASRPLVAFSPRFDPLGIRATARTFSVIYENTLVPRRFGAEDVGTGPSYLISLGQDVEMVAALKNGHFAVDSMTWLSRYRREVRSARQIAISTSTSLHSLGETRCQALQQYFNPTPYRLPFS